MNSKHNSANRLFLRISVSVTIIGFGVAVPCSLAADPVAARDAESWTKEANAAVLKELNFADQEDFQDAQRGFVAAPANAVIKGYYREGGLEPPSVRVPETK